MLTLADAILQQDVASVSQLSRYQDLNQIDEYGFTPLIEAAIINNLEISEILLRNGANPNFRDAAGGTALQWAVENSNLALTKTLLERRATANAYNFAGQPILVMPLLRRKAQLRQLLVKYGADLTFAQDYINTKLLGHMFELVGVATIVSPNNLFVEVDFEGFILEVTLGMIADSLHQFQNHFAARQLRKYSGIAQLIVEILQRGARLIQLQQYQTDLKQHAEEIDNIVQQQPLVIPVGYEGHAITFIRFHDIWIKCDRREDSRLYDNIMFYKVTNMRSLTPTFIKSLIYKKQSSEFINQDLDLILGLQPITELKVNAQISGNCSWANVEAAIPALFFLVLMQNSPDEKSMAAQKSIALNYFTRWREWNKDRALHYCIDSFNEGGTLRKASKAEILAAILFQRFDSGDPRDRERIELILQTLMNTKYEYIIRNYLRVYLYQSYTEEGKRFAEMLKDSGYKV